MRYLLVLLISFIFNPSVQAEIHKWTGPDGKVQYGDQPPTGKTETQKLAVPSAKNTSPEGASADTTNAPKTYAEKEQEFRKRRVEAEEAKVKAEKAKAEADLKARNCTQAKGNLSNLESGGRSYKYDSKGDAVFLEDKDRPKAIAEAQKEVASWCK